MFDKTKRMTRKKLKFTIAENNKSLEEDESFSIC